MNILIIDYGMGNLQSVANACRALGAEPVISDDPKSAAQAERIIMPGVGAFGDGMANLRARGWADALETEVRVNKKPFLGLCVGMQALAEKSGEHGEHKGLGWISGDVRRLSPADSALRVPHIGWNDVETDPHARINRNQEPSPAFYFVHSYAFYPADESVVAGWCDYGGRFAAVIESGNIFGAQFHPEKSQKCGLNLLRNFLELKV